MTWLHGEDNNEMTDFYFICTNLKDKEKERKRPTQRELSHHWCHPQNAQTSGVTPDKTRSLNSIWISHIFGKNQTTSIHKSRKQESEADPRLESQHSDGIQASHGAAFSLSFLHTYLFQTQSWKEQIGKYCPPTASLLPIWPQCPRLGLYPGLRWCISK